MIWNLIELVKNSLFTSEKSVAQLRQPEKLRVPMHMADKA